ncbi:MAG: penicillin-insensitive murein endopeptidase [Myxococcota bacterium]
MRWGLASILGLGLACLACGAAEVEVDDDWGYADESAVETIPGRTPLPHRPGTPKSSLSFGSGGAPGPATCSNSGEGPSRSIGKASEGSLENPCRIPTSGPGYLALSKDAWATDETIALLQQAARQVAEQFPGSGPVLVGGLSAEAGGFLPPHRSHQSGRDVDLGYFRTDQPNARRFTLVGPDELDAEKTWALIEALLYTGEVTFVFIDHGLQARLYEELVDQGWSEDSLQQLFQYPEGPTVPRGLIRHSPGHDNHLHVRFRCAAKDRPDCVD